MAAIEVGRVRELFRYPVKSMAGVALESAMLGWYGIAGDRRFAFRRTNDTTGFPWLTASRLPGLLLYQPFGQEANGAEPLPTHVRTPAGNELALRSDELRAELANQFGNDIELMKLNQGIFDAAGISLITRATLDGIAQTSGIERDSRRFRPNIVLETHASQSFHEDNWVGGTLIFGERETGAAISIMMRDERCMMINLDPDTARQHPAVLKAVVRMNQNNAGVYATVVREGTLAVGQLVTLLPSSEIASGLA